MSDFQTDDIDELLNAKETPEMSEDEKALRALQKEDGKLLSEFHTHTELAWPEPVRKRFLR